MYGRAIIVRGECNRSITHRYSHVSRHCVRVILRWRLGEVALFAECRYTLINALVRRCCACMSDRSIARLVTIRLVRRGKINIATLLHRVLLAINIIAVYSVNLSCKFNLNAVTPRRHMIPRLSAITRVANATVESTYRYWRNKIFGDKLRYRMSIADISVTYSTRDEMYVTFRSRRNMFLTRACIPICF